MRLRRNVAIFGTITLLFGCITLYWMTDLTFPQRYTSPNQEYKDNQWLHFDNRLKRLENDLNQHNLAVGEIKNAIEHLKPIENVIKKVDDINGINSIMKDNLFNNKYLKNKSTVKMYNYELNETSCPTLAIQIAPSIDVQMLEMYKRLNFDNIDGGVWKQGFQITYNEEQWSTHKKLKVFVVPHSHNDPGWLKTFEQYFNDRTKHIFNNMMDELFDNRKFIWAEISFLSLWWNSVPQNTRQRLKEMVESGRLEIVTGGWVMNDEANTHWHNMVLQLTEGHQWLQQHLNVTPRNGWTIDPFGESPTMAYLLKRANLDNLVIQRVHYSVKKELALKKQLEFRWRQFWDSTGETDLFTHMMPFYSYDIPHTCGPNPAVCCQFDFLRRVGYGLYCPWQIPPVNITDQNVAERSRVLLDQYRQKSQLYKTNVLLVPLGDDFRYERRTEWTVQYENYQKLFNYINDKKHLNTEIQFGTLNDYFNAVRQEKSLNEFPSLNGDFFTYADRDQHYWSGYYTSRPFYKRMDRILLAYLRAAEIITVLASNSRKVGSAWIAASSELSDALSVARKHLSLFQHHDGITGTARQHVVIDYGKKLLKAIFLSQRVIQHSANVLLSKSTTVPNMDTIYYDLDDHRTHFDSLPTKKVIPTISSRTQRIVFYNSLTYKRNEIVVLQVSSYNLEVFDSNSQNILCQISPIFNENSLSTDFYEVAFSVEVPALGLSTYTIVGTNGYLKSRYTVLSKVKLQNYDGKPPLIKGFEDIETIRVGQEFSIHNNKMQASFNKNGFLKALKIDSITYPVHLDFAKYGVTYAPEKSGAYLFLPDGEAEPLKLLSNLIEIFEGPIYSFIKVHTQFVNHSVILYNSTGGDGLGLEIQNIVDIKPAKNFELVMRLSTHINNDNIFFTDLNGYQIIRRERLPKLPIQGNYYPLPSLAYIEDEDIRMTVLTAGALGVSSLQNGQIEIMQDRQLLQDDNRGLGEGLIDNIPTKHTFRILFEKRQPNCHKVDGNHPAGFPSLAAHIASQSLLYPIYRLISNNVDNVEPLNSYSEVVSDLGVDLLLANVRSTVYVNEKTNNIGLIIHRQFIDSCFSNNLRNYFNISTGHINFSKLLPDNLNAELHEASLSYLKIGARLNLNEPQSICPMEIKAFLLKR